MDTKPAVGRAGRWTPAAVTAAAALAGALLGLSTNVASSMLPQDWAREHAGWVWGATGALVLISGLLGTVAVRGDHAGPLADHQVRPGSDDPGPASSPAAAGASGSLPTVWNVPPRNPHFTGRVEELTALHVALVAHPTVTVHALRGMGGVGKTQTVIEYAHRRASDYDVVWWFNAEQATAFADQFTALAVELGIEAVELSAVIAAVHRRLREHGRWLMIFDNAESPDELRPLIPTGSGRVLITTRQAGFQALGEILNVDTLRRPDSIALLKRRAPALSTTEAHQVAERLGDLPLALDQGAAYLDQTGMSAAEYLNLLDTRTQDMHSRGRAANHRETVATVWAVSFAQLQATSPAAVQLLVICAWLAPEPIPLDLFSDRPDLLPQPLSAAAADPIILADVVMALTQASLVRRSRTGLLMHRLVQDVARHESPSAGVHRPLLIALTQLAQALPDDARFDPANWSRYRELLPHVFVAVAHLQDHPLGQNDPVATDAVTLLLNHVGRYLSRHGRPVDARPLLSLALGLSEAAYGPDHPSVARELNQLGRSLNDLGRVAESLPLYERAARIHEVTLEPDDPAVTYNCALMASALIQLGRPEQALPLAQRAARIDEATYGPEYPYMARDLMLISRALSALGRPEEGLPVIERALEIDETAYGLDHPYVAFAIIQLSWTLCELGRPDEALPWAHRALSIHRATYGPNNHNVGSDVAQIARTLVELGRAAEALPLMQQALSIHQAAYEPDHPELANDLVQLGRTLIQLGRTDEALPMLREAERIRQVCYGSQHPDVVEVRRMLVELGAPAFFSPEAPSTGRSLG